MALLGWRLPVPGVTAAAFSALYIAAACGGETEGPLVSSHAGRGGAAGDAGGDAPTGCDAEQDCLPLGLHCNPLSQQCVGCFVERDCAIGEHCEAGTCLAIATCGSSIDCVGDPI